MLHSIDKQWPSANNQKYFHKNILLANMTIIGGSVNSGPSDKWVN